MNRFTGLLVEECPDEACSDPCVSSLIPSTSQPGCTERAGLFRSDPVLVAALRSSENDTFLDDCFWENQACRTVLLVTEPPAVYVRPLKRARKVLITGAGDCWRKLFRDDVRVLATGDAWDGPMTMSLFLDLLEEMQYVIDVTESPEEWWIDIRRQDDGDYHLEAYYYRPRGSGPFIRNCRDHADITPGSAEEDAFFALNVVTEVSDNAVLLEDLVEYGREVFELEQQVGGPRDTVLPQAPAAFDITIEPVAWEHSKHLVGKLARWYWRYRTEHPHVPRLSPVPPPEGHIPTPPLPAPGTSPPLEDMPHFLSPLEELASYLAWLASEAGAALRVAYESFVATLRGYGFDLDPVLQYFLLKFPDAVAEFARSSLVRARYLLEKWGVLDLIDHLPDPFFFLTGLVRDAIHVSANFLEWGMLGVKLINFLLQDFTEWHGPEEVYRRSLLAGALDFAVVPPEVLAAHGEGARRTVPAGLPVRVVRLQREAAEFDSTVGAVQPINNLAADRFRAAAVAIDALPTIVLPESMSGDDIEAFQRCVPTFNVVRGVTDHPHPRPAGIRRYFRQVAGDFLGARGRPVRAVGASNTEMPFIPRLIHNCWPRDSGRTAYRQDSFHTPANAYHRAMSHDHRFQDCPRVVNGEDVFGSDIWSFFSAHDIPPAEFIREMAESASNTAVVALHLPFPLLDRRVNSYTDPLAGLHYEVEGGRVLVYHLDGHSAGYSHDLECLIAWMTNLPTFENAHVQAEALAQVGTAVLLSLTVAEGKQEVVPSLWSCQQDPFYLLPELLGEDLRRTEPRFFAVAARKFEQLVAYVGSLDPTQYNNQYIIPKIRGMMAEIRIGVHTVEPRWSVTLPQLYSLVKHAVIAHLIYSRSVDHGEKALLAYYSREAWRHGTFWQRIAQGRIDLVMHFRGESNPLVRGGILRWLTHNSYHHKGVFNPYQRAGSYAVAALDVRQSNNLAPWSKVLQFAGSLGQSCWNLARAVTVRGVGTALTLGAVVAGPAVLRGPRSGGATSDADTASLVSAARVPLPPSVSSSSTSRPSSPLVGSKRVEDWVGSLAGAESGADGLPPLMSGALGPSGPEPDAPPPLVVPPPVEAEVPPAVEGSAVAPSVVGTGDSGLTSAGSDADVEPPPVASEPEEDGNPGWLEALAKRQRLYTLPAVGASQTTPRVVDFLGPVAPVSRQHPADDAFARLLAGSTVFRWPQEPVAVPCPSSGAASILEAVYVRRNVGEYPETYLPPLASDDGGRYRKRKHLVRALDSGGDTPEKAEALAKSLDRFVDAAVPLLTQAHRIKVCAVLGPPMSAKSSLVRSYLKRYVRRAVVYAPSKQLSADWVSDPDVAQLAVSYYRNRPMRGGLKAQVAVVDEVFNWSPLELGILLRMFASKGITTCFLVGDPTQCSPGGVGATHPWLARSVQMHTSLGMPLDSHGWFLQINNLDPNWYTTTGTRQHSVFFVHDEGDLNGYEPDLEFKMHSHSAGATELTVGRVQGSRARDALFRHDMNARSASWLNDTPAYKTVAVTRHTRTLVIHCNAVTRAGLSPMSRRHAVVGARVDTKHVLSPEALEDLVVPVKAERVTRQVSKLRAVMSSPLALEGHAVVLLPQDPPEVRPAALPLPASDLRTAVLEQTNFELPEPAERDFVASAPKVSFTFRPTGPPTARSDVRNDVESAHLLAAIHVNSSAFDAAKNLIDRQIATTKSSLFTRADVREGVAIYRRFRECFYARGATLVDVEVAASWLADTELAALAAIAGSAPLGEVASTLTCDAEFKTQTKAKAQPGFAATLPYGQSIIANKKVFNAAFAAEQPKVYTNLRRLMRPGAVLDYGMSDEQLSRHLASLGVACHMNGPENFQADVSKQDSSHTPGFLVAFLLVCRDCGMSADSAALYLSYCQRYGFTSRGEDAIRAAVSYNLGSGDPFTLIRNDVMEMCVIACRYKHADTMVIVEKGDDVHGWLRSLTPYRLAALSSIRQVRLTVDYGAVGYHAGRFHNGKRYLVDPVRAFLKHFTRLSDENVSEVELYKSFVSRATDYSDEEVAFLSAACQAHYPHYTSDVVDLMIHIILSMRKREVFARYCRLRVKDFAVAVDTKSNCVEQCLRLMYPRWPRAKLRNYRGRTLPELLPLLAADGVPHCLVGPAHFHSLPVNTLLLTKTHARVKVDRSWMVGKDL